MLSTLKTIITLIPLILDLIKAVEMAIPEGGKGKEKLAFIHDILTNLFPEVGAIWTQVEFVISRAVTLYNAIGVFRKV